MKSAATSCAALKDWYPAWGWGPLSWLVELKSTRRSWPQARWAASTARVARLGRMDFKTIGFVGVAPRVEGGWRYCLQFM